MFLKWYFPNFVNANAAKEPCEASSQPAKDLKVSSSHLAGKIWRCPQQTHPTSSHNISDPFWSLINSPCQHPWLCPRIAQARAFKDAPWKGNDATCCFQPCSHHLMRITQCIPKTSVCLSFLVAWECFRLVVTYWHQSKQLAHTPSDGLLGMF